MNEILEINIEKYAKLVRKIPYIKFIENISVYILYSEVMGFMINSKVVNSKVVPVIVILRGNEKDIHIICSIEVKDNFLFCLKYCEHLVKRWEEWLLFHKTGREANES